MAEEKKAKKKHTHAVHTVAAKDGTYVHHHEMKDHPDDPHSTMHENVATSANADDAGQHVADTMAQNGMEPEGAGEQPAPEEAAAGPGPEAAGPQA